MPNRLRQITAAIATVLVASCGGGTEDPIPDTTVASVTVSGSVTTIAPGSTTQLTAVAKNAAGTAIAGQTASWSSSATSVATVNASGLVTAVANGSATITATIAGIAGTKVITVQQVTAVGAATVTADNSNTFNPPQVDLTAGGTVTWAFNTVNDHNVSFSGAATGTPASIGNTKTGNVSRTFTTAGTFAYSCTNHPGMNGTIVVH
jgi:trimeric autotransporter adhesin